jgi:hypothetical protein
MHARAGGFIEVQTALSQDPSALVVLELGGTSASQFGRVSVQGEASLRGTLDLRLIGGFEPAPGDTFSIIDYQVLQDPFDSIVGSSIPNGLSLNPDYGPSALSVTAE